jgi:hypothetical protein
MIFQHVRSRVASPPSRSCARIPSALCQLAPLEHALTAALRHTSGMLGIPIWDQRSFHFVFGDHHHNYAGKMLETIYKYIYITWNTSIKYAIIIDVVHVHNIIILIHIIYLHLKPPSSSWCISYIYIYDLSWFDFDLPWMPSDPSNNQTDRLILGELRGVENLKAVLPVVASKWCGVKSLRFKEWFTLR